MSFRWSLAFSVLDLLLLAACGRAEPQTTPPSPSATLEVKAPWAPPVLSLSAWSAVSQPAPAPSFNADPPNQFAVDKASNDAQRCLDDPGCDELEALRLTNVAADAGGATHCDILYYGELGPKDWPRARACYERAVAKEGRCVDGASSSPERLILVTMLIDGQGGAVDKTRGAHLFEGCFEDPASLWMSSETTREARIARGRPLDFCTDVGGTTLAMTDCAWSKLDGDTVTRKRLLKRLATTLGTHGLELESKAYETFEAYMRAESARIGDEYRGGSMRPIQEAWASTSLFESRNQLLESLLQGAKIEEALGRAAAERELLQAEETVTKAASDPDARALVGASRSAFARYHAIETSFEAAARGGGSAATRDAWVRLARERANQLKPTP